MKPNIQNILLSLFFAGISFNSNAKNYYLSSDGNDTNKGISISASWKSIDRLNRQKLSPGDSVFFKCGDVFAGEILIAASGTPAKPVVYTSYGSGSNPVITGAVELTVWESSVKEYLTSNVDSKVYSLFCNKKKETLARYPNSGYLKIDGGGGCKLKFYDFDLTQENAYWNGSDIRFKSYDWEWRKSKVTDFSNHQLTIADSSSNRFNPGWGYFLDNKFDELDTIGEWYYSDSEKKIFYIPENKNISGKRVEACIFRDGITINENVSNIMIENLTLTMFENSAVWAKGNNENIRIYRNTINSIINTAIFLDLHSKKCSIESNIIKDISGRGIFALEPEFLSVKRNRILRIGLSPGYGISGVNGMVGIAIANIEELKTENSRIAHDNIIAYNLVDSIGYGGIRLDGANNVLEFNEVGNVMIYLSDGAAIYCWAKGKYYTHDNIIRNNIIYNCTGNREATPSPKNVIANGVYVDNNCYNIQVANNTVYNISGSGIHVNSDAYDNKVTGNTIYNCGTGFSIAEWATPGTTYGNLISENIVFCKTGDQSAVELDNWLLPSTHSLGTLSKNTYFNFFEKYFLKESYLSADKEEKVNVKYTFEAWKAKYGHDKDGMAYQLKSELADFSNSRIIVNNENNKKDFTFNNIEMYDLQGSRINSITLRPFESQILLYR
jgi:hypothetical protein